MVSLVELVLKVSFQGSGSRQVPMFPPDDRCTSRWQALYTIPTWIASTAVSRLPFVMRQAATDSATMVLGIDANTLTSFPGSPTALQNESHNGAGNE